MEVSELAALRSGAPPATGPAVLDVREPWEREIAALPDTIDIPMGEVPDRLDELRALRGDRDMVVMCRSGQRSHTVARFLQQNGFKRVFNLNGGILAWSQQIDDSVHQY